LSRRLLSFLAVCTALFALWAWAPGLFQTSVPLDRAEDALPKQAPEPTQSGLPANVFLLSDGEHLAKNGVLVWWQGPERAPRRFEIRNGGARVGLADWAALNEQATALTVELEQSFPAAVLSSSVANGGAGETRLLLDLGKTCALSIQAIDFDHEVIPCAKLELWGADQSLGPAQDCGPTGHWEGTVFQADRLTLTVSAQGYAPIGMRFPRPAASRFSETVALPRIMAGGLVLDRRQNTLNHSVGYAGWGLDLAPWSEGFLREAELSIKLGAENERVLWFVEPECLYRNQPVVHVAQYRADRQGPPIATTLALKPLVGGSVRLARTENDWPQELVAIDLVVGPRDAWLARALPDRLVLGIEREDEAVVAQTAYRVPGNEPRFRFFVRPGWVRFLQLGGNPNFQFADYPPILASDWFQVKTDAAAIAQLDVLLEPGVFYSEYRFLDSAGRVHPGAGRIFGVAAKPSRPAWSELLVRSPRPQTSYFRAGGTAQMWLAGRSGVGYLISDALPVLRPTAGEAWKIVVSEQMLARLGD
jgi:hypothetical protein